MAGKITLIPRPYQLDAARKAIANNSVINICTGGGKTLIAVIVINEFILSSTKVVCFLVPSRALVTQQSEYLRKNCEGKNGKELRVAGKMIFKEQLKTVVNSMIRRIFGAAIHKVGIDSNLISYAKLASKLYTCTHHNHRIILCYLFNKKTLVFYEDVGA